ncbi:MAG: GH25 family lysozyme [Eubacteriales bacterium]|nr:GH25 family lysozyme [Eubacteriales bacterium]
MSTLGSNEHDRENPNKRKTAYLVNLIVMSLVTLAAVVFCAVLLVRGRTAQETLAEIEQESRNDEGEVMVYSEEKMQEQLAQASESAADTARNEVLQQVQSALESGESTISMLRSLFSDDLVVLNNGKYYFYPVLDSVKKNAYANDDFAFDDGGLLQYDGEDEAVRVRQGIDVSEESGFIDWEAVAGDQITYVMVRIGESAQDGSISRDEYFTYNLESATQEGLQAGVYFELLPGTEEEVRLQAQEVSERLQEAEADGERITLPVAVSVMPGEDTQDDAAQGQSQEEWTQNTIAFCEEISAAGYTPMIYGNLVSFTMMLDLEQLEDYDKWIANYDDILYFPYQFAYWQYTSTGQVQGISGDVHRDIYLYRNAFAEGETGT